MKTVLLLKQKLLQYGFDPSSYSALQAFKDAVTSWAVLLQFKNLIIQTLLIFFIITILMFLHIRQKIRGFQLGNLLIYKEQLAFTVQAVF